MRLHAPCSPSLAPLHYPAQATPRIFNNSHQIRQIFFFCLQAVSLLLLLPPTHPSKRQSWMMRAVKTNAENSKTQKPTKAPKSESNFRPGYTLPSYFVVGFLRFKRHHRGTRSSQQGWRYRLPFPPSFLAFLPFKCTRGKCFWWKASQRNCSLPSPCSIQGNLSRFFFNFLNYCNI